MRIRMVTMSIRVVIAIVIVTAPRRNMLRLVASTKKYMWTFEVLLRRVALLRVFHHLRVTQRTQYPVVTKRGDVGRQSVVEIRPEIARRPDDER
jgi:hypothetical protein